jgi:predicted MFS family arabinose efflux permease
MSSKGGYTAIPEGNLDEDIIKVGDEGLDDDLMQKNVIWVTPPTIIAGITSDKLIMGIGYMLSMGVCGIVLVALGSTLESLASNVNRTATEIGTVFITRGFGAILGAVLSAKLYKWFLGNHVIFFGLLSICLLLVTLPFVRSNILLHIFFMFLGLMTAITDTGCQIMTRKLHGKQAGPWLGANTVSFGISGAFVPIIAIFTGSLNIQYFSMSAIVFAVSLIVGLGPNPEKNGKIPSGPPKREGQASQIAHYRVEMTIGLMVFFFIGGKVTTTAYLASYVEQTKVIDTYHENFLILVLWISITIGRLAGVYDQRFLTNKSLPVHLTIFCIGGFASMLLIIWFPKNPESLWIGVAFYGLFNGPCVGYCYDLNNRITYPSEASMAIVMFGLNFGASLVPYATSIIWNAGGGPRTLILVVFMTMIMPLPLLFATRYLSYDPAVNPNLSNNRYSSLPQSDDSPI